MNKKSANGLLCDFIRPYFKRLLLAFTMLVSSNSVSIVILYFFKVIIDRYMLAKDIKLVYLLAVTSLCVILADFFISKIQIKSIVFISNNISHNLRVEFFKHLLKSRYDQFRKKKYGDINTNIIQDIDSLADLLFNKLLVSITDVFYYLITGLILLFISVKLTLVLFATMMLFFYILLIIKKYMLKKYNDFALSRSELNVKINEVLEGMKVIKLYNRGEFFINNLRASNEDFVNKWLLTNIFSPSIRSSIEIAITITYIMIFLIGSLLIQKNEITIGGMLLFLTYAPQLWDRFIGITDLYSHILNMGVYSNRIFSGIINDNTEEDKITGNCNDLDMKASKWNYKDKAASIRIDHTFFAYENGKNILNDYSMSINKPGLYCIVGESGIGKSTLFELLLGFYTADKGNIYVNNKNIRSMNIHELRTVLGIIHQDSFLISGTVFDNIKFGESNLTEQRIINTAKALGFHKYLLMLDSGYETILYNSGKGISSGQRKMIHVLRVLCREPQILLLDEITSNVDSFTKEIISNFLIKMSQEKICLLITHKSEDLDNANEIIKL